MDPASAVLWIALRTMDVHHPRIQETVTVRMVARAVDTPAAVTTIWRAALDAAPAVTLDDTLRSVPGFSLFRRSSSRVANPTTQGATLRGLAASGASRALVLADNVPLNDPVGGWVYWNRIPTVAIGALSVERGAAGDLHGADALAGAVYITTDSEQGARVLLDGGTHGTMRASVYGGGNRFSGAAEWFHTDGFITVAPESRGAIDTPAASRHGSGHVAVDWGGDSFIRVARATHFIERRRNGTPYQRNATRITQGSVDTFRWPAGVSTGWALHGYALTQKYEQTFSAVRPGRSSEQPASEQNVHATAAGASADLLWNTPRNRSSVVVSGKHVSAQLEETEFTTDTDSTQSRRIDPRQMTFALAGQTSFHLGRFAVGGGVRAELWRSELQGTKTRGFMNPRVWVTHSGRHLTWNLALQSGYRGPTINELYRPFRVGNVLTLANPALKPERARGIEAGVLKRHRRATIRSLLFWTRVDDSIVNVTLGSQGVIVRERQNAARIHATGVEVELEVRVSAEAALTASSTFTNSRFVTGFLDGLRVPQVPRTQHAVGGRGSAGPLRYSAELRYIGRQFDDDRNLFLLGESFTVDGRLGWRFTRQLEAFAAIENLLDEEQDVGRTPIRTIGLPRTTRVGLRLTFH